MIKKTLLFFSFLALFNCTDNQNINNCIQSLPLNITTDLNNPSNTAIQVPGGSVEIAGGSKGILLLNTNGTDFIAYDKLCPANDCSQPMTFERGIVLKCPCDNSEYGIGRGIGGAPQTEGFLCPAIEYRVIRRGSVLRITNF